MDPLFIQREFLQTMLLYGLLLQQGPLFVQWYMACDRVFQTILRQLKCMLSCFSSHRTFNKSMFVRASARITYLAILLKIIHNKYHYSKCARCISEQQRKPTIQRYLFSGTVNIIRSSHHSVHTQSASSGFPLLYHVAVHRFITSIQMPSSTLHLCFWDDSIFLPKVSCIATMAGFVGSCALFALAEIF